MATYYCSPTSDLAASQCSRSTTIISSTSPTQASYANMDADGLVFDSFTTIASSPFQTVEVSDHSHPHILTSIPPCVIVGFRLPSHRVSDCLYTGTLLVLLPHAL